MPWKRDLIIAITGFALGFALTSLSRIACEPSGSGIAGLPAYDNIDTAVVIDGPGPIAQPYDVREGVDRIIKDEVRYIPLGSSAGQKLLGRPIPPCEEYALRLQRAAAPVLAVLRTIRDRIVIQADGSYSYTPGFVPTYTGRL